MKALLFALFIVLGFFQVSIAQDIVVLNNGKTIHAKVLEINATEVLYKVSNNLEGPVYRQAINGLQQITFENGVVQKFSNKTSKPAKKQKFIPYKNALKVEVLSLASGHLGVNYERVLKDKVGFEIKTGVVGLGNPIRYYASDSYSDNWRYETGESVVHHYHTSENKEKGFFIKAGPKFMFNSKNSLHGAYFKPEVFFGQFGAEGNGAERHTDPFYPMDDRDYSYTYTFSSVNWGATANFGAQAVLGSRLTLDANIGFGFSMKNDSFDQKIDSKIEGGLTHDYFHVYEYMDSQELVYRYSHSAFGGFAITAGIALGYAF